MKTTSFLVLLPLALAGCADRSTTDPSPFAACAGGAAADFECSGVNLLGFVPVSELGTVLAISDLWGWTDPSTGNEYAIVGRSQGTAFVDITDPTNPVVVGDLPMTPGARASSWRDIKVYADHAFIVADGAAEHGVQIFDLTRLRGVSGETQEFSADLVYDNVASVHNIAIDPESGLAVVVGSNGPGETCGGGLHMLDVTSPQSPVFLGCYADMNTRRGYVHDVQCVTYDGPDTRYIDRQICLSLAEDAVSITDVSDPANPVAVGLGRYPATGYTHQGWLTDDHRYFYVNDEFDEQLGLSTRTRTIIWDLAQLDDPVLLGEYRAETTSIDHNLYVVGDVMYQANYTAGLRVLDISDPGDPVEIGYFDTTPGNETTTYSGAWSVYPFFESGTIAVSSINEGLFLFEVAGE